MAMILILKFGVMFFMQIIRGLSVVLGVSMLLASPARALCLPQEHITTVYEVIDHYFERIVGVSSSGVNTDATQMWVSWNDAIPLVPSFVHDTIQPAFAKMAEQWTMSEMKGMEIYETLSTNRQHKLTEAESQRIKADIMARLQPNEAICSRATMGSAIVSTNFKAVQTARQILSASLSQHMAKPGTAGGLNPADSAITRFDYYQNNGCSEDEMGGAFSGFCAAVADSRIGFDINPATHFEQMTVTENDPSGTTGAGDLQGYMQNVCGGKSLSLLPSRYYEEHNQNSLVNEVYGYWQYGAFCHDSIASYASLKAPGSEAITPEQQVALTEVGYDANAVTQKYGQNPSKQSQMSIMIESQFENPKVLGPDQMMNENAIFAYDALSLAMETMLLDQYKDIFSQETRNLSLYLGLAVKEQRKKANAGLSTISNQGKKS